MIPLSKFFLPGLLAAPLLFVTGTALADPTWTLVWEDAFNGAANAPPDPTRWTYDLGGGGWGNAELETYTNSVANCSQDGSGHLVIQAIDTAGNYTSARIKTETLFDQAYGRVEASIQIPWGNGIWPAFWMLGSNIATVGWPACGEIDLMENLGQYDAANVIGGHIHGPVNPGGGDYNGGNGVGSNYTLPSGNFTNGYHLFAAEWNPAQIVFYVDGTAYQTITAAALPTGGQWVFNHPFFLLLNLAVGGTAGNPASTSFPEKMLVDYVRVYKRTDNGTAAYPGAAAVLPGTVQAENYDSYSDVSDPAEPAEGFGYNGLGPSNLAGQYRPGDAVSIETCSDTGGGYDVTNTSPGQWLQYSVNASQAGIYTLDARVASSGAGGSFHVDVDGTTVTGELSAPATGGWQNWQTVSAGGVTLSAGAHKVLLVEDGMGASNLGVCNFNYLDFSLPSPTASSSPSPTSTLSPTAVATSTRSTPPTADSTPSLTESATASPVGTASASPTIASPSDTPSPATTASATAASASSSPSPTPTLSPTAVATSTVSASPTDDLTATPSVPPSATPTPSPTFETATLTPSLSPTLQPSVTASPTTIILSTDTATASATVSGTAILSPSATDTPTPSSVASPSPAAAGPSATATPASPPFLTPTPSTKSTQASGDSGRLLGYPVPNPNPHLLKIFVPPGYDSIRILVTTTALDQVTDLSLGNVQPGWLTLALPDVFTASASNGLYYFQIVGIRDGAADFKPFIGKFFVLR